MNNKGFTLMELLGVIILLALIALLTGTAITNVVKDSKKDLSDIQIKSIKKAAESWGAENLNKLPDDGECIYITLNTLKKSGLLDINVINPETKEEISDDLKIKISTESNKYGKSISTYEVNPSDVSGCSSSSTCELVSGDLKTYGSVVTCSTESFYVMPDHELAGNGTVSLLRESTMYGGNYNNGAQSGIVFSSENYWGSIDDGSFVYDEDAYTEDVEGVGTYLKTYKEQLSGIGLSESSTVVTLPSYNQISTTATNGAFPEWIHGTDDNITPYWLGTMESADYFYIFDPDYQINFDSIYYLDDINNGTYFMGVRPVVIIDESQIN